jgi:hypothetical protein
VSGSFSDCGVARAMSAKGGAPRWRPTLRSHGANLYHGEPRVPSDIVAAIAFGNIVCRVTGDETSLPGNCEQTDASPLERLHRLKALAGAYRFSSSSMAAVLQLPWRPDFL